MPNGIVFQSVMLVCFQEFDQSAPREIHMNQV
jgi:hypothetical protein